MSAARAGSSGPKAPLGSPLEASPELRQHRIERARLARRIIAVPLALVLLAAVGWAAWGAWNVRAVSTRAQTPMRGDKAAIRRLDADKADLTLLVMRGASETTASYVLVVHQPAEVVGSWVLALPAATIPGSNAASETPTLLLRRGRATLIKAVEGLLGSKLGHYIELDQARVFDALSGTTSVPASDTAFAAARAVASNSPSAAVAALTSAAERYGALREGNLALLRVPIVARSLAGAVVSDLGAVQLDGFLRRLGADAAQGHVRTVVVPLEPGRNEPLISASAASALVAQMVAGSAFSLKTTAVKRVVPGSVTVSVLNGAGREGVAAQATRILRRAGYRIIDKDVGNANQFVYDSTLVVYEKDSALARAVARSLPIGRAVASRGMYSFATDVLVIVGKDWP